jgi:protein-S-isoprenylcysteine O-methyltransferase Ste14
MIGLPWTDRLFRQARAAGAGWNLTKTLLQIVVFWSTFLVLIPRGLVALERYWGVEPLVTPFSRTTLWAMLLLASALGLTSGILMAVSGAGTPLPLDAPRRLVVRGPYCYVRNPMAIAGLTQGACAALLFQSWFALALVPAGFVVWNYVVRPLEERHLESMFGDEFRAYRRDVRCWIPRLRLRP